MIPLIQADRRGVITVPKWLTFLGAASYSIYLVHNPVISVVARFVQFDPYALLAAAMLLGTLGGVAYYLLFEKHVIRIGLPKRRAIATPSDGPSAAA